MTDHSTPAQAATPTFGQGFAPVTHQTWARAVGEVMTKSGRQVTNPDHADDLLIKRVEDLTVNPLYHPASHDVAASNLSGLIPDRPHAAWQVMSVVEETLPTQANERALHELENGAHGLWLTCHDGGLTPEDLPTVLNGVLCDLAPIMVDQPDGSDTAAAALVKWWDGQDQANAAQGWLGIDPLGVLARTGQDRPWDQLSQWARACESRLKRVRPLLVDARPYDDAGASSAQTLGLAIASLHAYARHLGDEGLATPTVLRSIALRLPGGADQFLTTATLRAARVLWARVVRSCGEDPQQFPLAIHAVTSWRMMSRDDPWVNLLRTTTAVVAAATGGADAITALPFDAVHGKSEDLGWRMARHTSSVLALESHLGYVQDPAAGSWYVETLTQQIVDRAWQTALDVEQQGGIRQALLNGWVHELCDQTRQERRKQLATRRIALTGVSEFPLANETPLEREPHAHCAHSGGLPRRRDAEPFEYLRDQGKDTQARVALVTLGKQANYVPRLTFAGNVFAVAGIDAPHLDLAEELDSGRLKDLLADVGTSMVCLCANDRDYERVSEENIRNLRAAGVHYVMVAGGNAEQRKNWQQWGVDQVIALGMNVESGLSAVLNAWQERS